MTYHSVVKQILRLLESGNYRHETFQHEPVRTSEEAAKVRTGYNLRQGAKALILKIKTSSGKKFVMVVIPGDSRLDSKG